MNMRSLSFCIAASSVLWASTASATVARYQDAVRQQAGLVSYFTFDLADVTDSFGPNNGTTQGPVTFGAGVGGGARQGLSLPGNAHVKLGQVEAFDFANGTGSIEAWVRAGWTTMAYNPCLFADRDGGPVNWSIHMNSDKRAVGMWNGSGYQTMAIPSAGANWHHFVVTFDGGSMAMYWDGVALGTLGHAPSGNATTPTQIGSSSEPLTAEGWSGSLDEVAFYSEALTAEAAQAHYMAFLAGDPPIIKVQPKGGVFLSGNPFQLTVDVTGADVSYQWFKGGNPHANATNATLAFSSLTAADAGAYKVNVFNSAGTVTSDEAVVVVTNALPARLNRYQTAVRQQSGLISYYSFDHWNLEDGFGLNNGSPQGAVTYGPGVGGDAALSLLLAGNGHVNLGQVDAFDFYNGAGAIEAWVSADWTSIGNNPALFADRDGGPVNWSVHMNADKKVIGMWNGFAYKTFTIPDAGSNWHHFAASFDAGEMTYYWDGVPLGTLTQGFGPNPEAPTELGSSSAPVTAEGWTGKLDEIAFFSEPLSADAVRSHYNAFMAGDPPTITQQPLGGTFLPGNPFDLIVQAAGADLNYQWFKNNAAILDATNAILHFASLATTDTGSYRVTVTNLSGTVSSGEVALLVPAPNMARYQAAVQRETNLISYYTFDAGDASDWKGLHPGEVIGSALFDAGLGDATNKTLLLDGSSQVSLGAVSDFDFPGGTGTVEAWIRADWTGVGYNPCLFAARDGGNVNWSIHMNSGKDAIGDWNGANYFALPVSGIGTAWHHFAMAFGDNHWTLYLDGEQIGTVSQSIGAIPDAPTQIGSVAASAPAEAWVGALDEVAFYKTELSADSIRSHYQALIGVEAKAPAIAFSRIGGELKLTWPADASGFILESTDTLPSGAWTPVTGAANNTATIILSNGSRFYRLRKP